MKEDRLKETGWEDLVRLAGGDGLRFGIDMAHYAEKSHETLAKWYFRSKFVQVLL